MLAKKHRLNLSLENNALIFAKGNAFFCSSKFFLAYFKKNNDYLKATCLVPKAVFSKATHRNFYRRLIYSFLEKEIKKKNFSLLEKSDLVVVAKRNFPKDKMLLSEDFIALLKEISGRLNHE